MAESRSSFSRDDYKYCDDPPMSRLFVISNKNCTEDDFRDSFGKYGDIEDIWILKDKGTGENKGVAYIKFNKSSEAARALEELNGKCIGVAERPIKVLIASSRQAGSKKMQENEQERYARLFIVVPKSATEDDIRDEFSKYGDVEHASIIKDRTTGQNKGFGYVKYHRLYHAALAFENCPSKYKAVFAEPKSSKPPSSDSSRDDSSTSFGGRNSEMVNFLKLQTAVNQPTSLEVICSNRVNQDQLWRLFDIIPGLDYCQVNRECGPRNLEATVVFNNPEAALYAREKLHGLEYPPGERLIVKISAHDSRGDSDYPEKNIRKDSLCNVELPPQAPMAASDATVAKRCFIVLHSTLPDKILKYVFSTFGNLIDVYLLPKKNCGYAKYATVESAQRAINTLNGAEVCGVRIKVMEAQEPNEDGRKRMRWDCDGENFNESLSDGLENDSTKRMTRLRARGGVRDKPPIIDDDEDEFIPVQRKRKPGRKQQPAERHKVEKEKDREKEQERLDKERDVTTDETSLYFTVRHSKAAIASIVDDWIESYKLNRDTALIALMQFFINASGCKGKITAEMQQSMEHTAIIRKMTEEFDEECVEYPLIMSGQQWKKFKMIFCDFVQTLVKQCQYSIIYDQFIMDNVLSLLTGLSDSQDRAFRHTATLAAMKLITALVDVALLVSVNFDNAARQYEAERLKTRDKRATERLESLMSKRTELEENMDEIKNMLTYIFKSVFVHRYRDTLPDIRAICMTEISVCMQNFSENFLDDSYLKYIGWTLHDKVGEVRLRCLQALLPLYACEELKGKLELFTSKFKDRIVAMTLDKEFEVAVHAVKLVISILKIHPEILTDKDCEIVYELVYSSHRGVAQAAAEFLNVRLFHLSEGDLEIVKTKRGKTRLPNTPLIRDLVQFFIESELHEHGAYLVDSFIDNNTMVKDWECMTDLLLEEPGPTEEQLDNKQESTLIEIMVSSVRQSATGEAPVGRGSNRKMTLSVKELKQVLDDKIKLTEHFIVTLPPLLEKYQADAEKLTNLLSIPQFFDLDIYTTSRQEANLQALLDKMGHIMSMHTDRDVLETCAKTLEYLCSEGSATYTKCDVARSNIIDQCVNRYREALDEWRNLIEGEELPNEDEIYAIIVSLKIVSILYSCHNLNPWSLFDSLYQDIDECQSRTNTDRGLPHEALVYCIEAAFFSINWGLFHIENNCETSTLEETSLELRSHLYKYINACCELVRNGPTTQIQEAAYMSICDLLIIFSDQLATNENVGVQKLEYKPSADQQGILNEFVQQIVFYLQHDDGQDETRIEELHKKRNFLAVYCKLIVYNIIPTKVAADIFKHYVRYSNEYGDIIKTTLGKAREINKINFSMAICLCLVGVFKDLQQTSDHSQVSKNSQEFVELKKLAKRFALSFGHDAVKNRKPLIALHRAGILFAVSEFPDEPAAAPTHLGFLEIFKEFTNKLIKQDKKVILSFLNRRISPGIPSSRNKEWQPLVSYRNSFLHGDTDQPPVVIRKSYVRRRRDHDDDVEEEEDGHNDPDFMR